MVWFDGWYRVWLSAPAAHPPFIPCPLTLFPLYLYSPTFLISQSLREWSLLSAAVVCSCALVSEWMNLNFSGVHVNICWIICHSPVFWVDGSPLTCNHHGTAASCLLCLSVLSEYTGSAFVVKGNEEQWNSGWRERILSIALGGQLTTIWGKTIRYLVQLPSINIHGTDSLNSLLVRTVWLSFDLDVWYLGTPVMLSRLLSDIQWQLLLTFIFSFLLMCHNSGS